MSATVGCHPGGCTLQSEGVLQIVSVLLGLLVCMQINSAVNLFLLPFTTNICASGI